VNELIYQQGGTLYLDEPWAAQPTAATITIRTLADKALSTLGGGFVDIEDLMLKFGESVAKRTSRWAEGTLDSTQSAPRPGPPGGRPTPMRTLT
jgi:hypothetical protein